MSLLLAALLAGAPPPAEPPRAQARLVRETGATRVEASFPGNILGYAVPLGAEGRRELLVLVAPAPLLTPRSSTDSCGAGPVRSHFDRKDGAIRLYRVSQAPDSPLDEIRADLPADTRGLDAADVDGDGLEDLLVLREGRIDALLAPGFDGELRPFDEPEADRYPGSPLWVRSRGAESGRVFRLVTVGGLRTYAPVTQGAPISLVSEVPLPVTVGRKGAGLAIDTRAVSVVGRGKDGATLLATSPLPVGNTRLRVWLVSPEAPPSARAVDCWLRLPSPERLLDSAFFLLDGSPFLAVTTTSAEKLGLFSEKLLRVFPLRPDRTRAGTAPAFATETRMNLWQEPRFHVADVDGDGKQDLLLAYWKGLKNGTAVLDTYLRRPDGSFATSERSEELELSAEDRSFLEYGDDVDGDGTSDLMLLGDGKLLVFPGNRDTKGGKAIVSSSPTLSTPISGAPTGDTRVSISIGSEGVSGSAEGSRAGQPAVLDLDGDGKREVLFVSDSGTDPGKLVIVSFHGGAPASR